LLMDRYCREQKGEFVQSEKEKKMFRTYSWPGNIRELRNLAEYFCFTGSQVITVKDLPPTFQYDGIGAGLSYSAPPKTECPEPVLQPDTAPWKQAMWERGLEPEEYWFVLKMLFCSSENGETVGRERILDAARREKLLLSQPAVRSILGIFREYGLAKVGRGRGGSRITSLGRKIWEGHEYNQINQINNQNRNNITN
ncbi:MAG: Fis family transcriptional regulator, partial [Clostridia bacterium]|nr:Fis family transcriptional regulator [Clostridia bacterium]